MEITHNFLVLPSKTLDVEALLRQAGKTRAEIEQTIATTGITKLCHAGDRRFTGFVIAGLQAIADEDPSVLRDVDAVIVVSQTYDQRIPCVSTRIQKLFNLNQDTFCLDIMDGCSGYIKALSIASMLNNSSFKKVLIIAGDINSVMTADAEVGTKVLFGDGLSITILEAGAKELDTRTYNDGDITNTISCDTRDNLMHMNGFEVFRFTRSVVPRLIGCYLKEANRDLGSYDLIALHQASHLVVSTICNTLKLRNTLNRNFACGEIGNLGAGGIGAWLSQGRDLTSLGELKMLAVGFGSGLSWGIASLTVHLRQNRVIHV